MFWWHLFFLGCFFLIPNTSVVHSTWTQYTKCCAASFILPSISGRWQLASKLTPASDSTPTLCHQIRCSYGGRGTLLYFAPWNSFDYGKPGSKYCARTHTHTDKQTGLVATKKTKKKTQMMHEASRFICPRIPIWGQIKQPVRKMSAQSPRKLN